MNKKIFRIILVIILASISVFIAGYFAYTWLFVLSDHTELKGEIISEKSILAAGETLTLKLKVPEELDAIHRISWHIDPENIGRIDYKEVGAWDNMEDKEGSRIYPKVDRTAVFTAKKTGNCTIYARGFYKQTNPQPIASITIEVR